MRFKIKYKKKKKKTEEIPTCGGGAKTICY